MMSELPNVVADVGGTNARFALVNPGETEVFNAETLPVKDFENLSSAFRHYANGNGLVGTKRLCVALAGPIDGDDVQLTNGDWAFSISDTRSELGLLSLILINDFKAQAMALAYIGEDQLVLLGGRTPVQGRPKVIVGPGTGLGVAALVPNGERYTVVESEGGHSGLAPTSEHDIAIYRKLLQQYGRVSAERVLCGAGLRNLYSTLGELDGVETGSYTEAEIVEEALAGTDASCLKALDVFLAYLGAVAGDFALTFGALGGVYIAGGIVPRVKDHIANTEFRSRFEAKGRLSYMQKDIPTYLVMSEHAGLIGAAACLNDEVC